MKSNLTELKKQYEALGEEIQEVLEGKDLWLSGEDTIKRLEKVAKVRGGK